MRSKTPTRPTSEALAADLRKRLRGLTPAQSVLMRQIIRRHAAGDRQGFAIDLLKLHNQAPNHPEVLFWMGVMHSENADWGAATKALEQAAAERQDDFQLWTKLAIAQGNLLATASARQSFQRATGCEGTAQDWLNLSIECDRQGFYEEALSAADAALRLDRHSAVALLQRSRCHKALGNAEAAANDCRTLIRLDREVARAWFALVDLKTVALRAGERQQLVAATQRSALTVADRQLLDFAYGQVLEDAGEFAEALAVFQRANALERIGNPWHGAGSVNSTITVSASGAVGAGSSAVTGCSISGAGAASFGAVTTTPANGVFNSSTTAGSINLSCTRGAVAATATLACTETATPTVAGSPFTRSWNLTCPAAPTVLVPTTIPSLGTVSLWMMVLSFLGLGMLFATRARS